MVLESSGLQCSSGWRLERNVAQDRLTEIAGSTSVRPRSVHEDHRVSWNLVACRCHGVVTAELGSIQYLPVEATAITALARIVISEGSDTDL